VTMAKVTSAELLRALRDEAARLSGIVGRLIEAVATVTDPTADRTPRRTRQATQP